MKIKKLMMVALVSSTLTLSGGDEHSNQEA